MKNLSDLAQGLLRKAASDWASAQLCLEADIFDNACFHAQQAAEKYLKAFLASQDVDHFRTHDMEKLLGQCIAMDKSFSQIENEANILSSYAVNVRYEIEFWPTAEEAVAAIESAYKIRDLVIDRVPPIL